MITEGIILLEDSNLYKQPTEYRLGNSFKKGDNIINNEECTFYIAKVRENGIDIYESWYNNINSAFHGHLHDHGSNWIHKVEVE